MLSNFDIKCLPSVGSAKAYSFGVIEVSIYHQEIDLKYKY